MVPCADDVRAAAGVLNAGKKTVILAGQGALGAAAELEQLADLMAAPIVKPLLGKGAVPDDSPFTTEASDSSARSHPKSRWRKPTRC